ncbi:NAD(P)H-binding protein [Thiocystis violascens]|uniref:Putative nucleoside-diphosphate sugar epimerase n=1 Tax=Thiocystis violascens (strain ATCC 17096 / DSM 198 / 6111) TaxID=765911 RepID=I3YBK1_THIV6|nr:NAD(P)H-binding protein [Thiocystis violascens]AFL74369.1 putative nucleoside-diphosphate sugar epimerase [Thiocystis violascens DSM 198]
MSQPPRPRVVVAGASGFIGTAVCRALAARHEVVALTRSPARARTPDSEGHVAWRQCDLFSARAVTASLEGAEYAIYLVHSLAPSSRLTQAQPRDMDLILADNFALAAAANGVRQILFVGGVIPDGFRISPLLWNRREVELILASRGTPVTTLRAGLVVGPGGSAPRLLVDLVRRLPLLALPSQAGSVTRPIALDDLVRALLHCLGQPETCRGAFDIGGPESLSYETMLRQTAEVLGVRRRFLRLPYLPLWLVSLTARLIGGAPSALVGPVVESLPHDIRMRDNPVQRAIDPDSQPFRAALAAALDPRSGRLRPNPRQPLRDEDRHCIREASRVRSIQRILLPPGQDAHWVAGNYFRWLGGCCWPFIETELDADGRCEVRMRFPRVTLLSLQRLDAESTPDRQIHLIVGGLLSRARGPSQARFEFHTLLGGRYTMAAIHDYQPSLPWFLYRVTQAVFHLLVMRRYQDRLARLAR